MHISNLATSAAAAELISQCCDTDKTQIACFLDYTFQGHIRITVYTLKSEKIRTLDVSSYPWEM